MPTFLPDRPRPRRRALCTVVVAASLTVLGPASAAAGAPDDLQRTLADYGYGETTLTTTYGSAEWFLPSPALSEPDRIALTFEYEHSPLLTDESTLTILAGGVPLGSVGLSGSATSGSMTVEVPSRLVGPDGLVVAARAYLRVTDRDCEDDVNPAKWLRVSPSSAVVARYRPVAPTLDRLGELLAGRAGPGEPHVVDIVVGGSGPDDPELDAASALAWTVGRRHRLAGTDPLVTLDGAGASASPTAVIELTAGDDVAVGRTDGVPTLSVGAADVPSTATSLADDRLVASLEGDRADLTGLTPAGRPERAAPWTGTTTTFAQLGLPRRVVTGTGIRDVFYRIDRPARWELRGDAVVTLDVDASSALARTSTVQLFVNGVDVGTAGLPTGRGTVEFELSQGLADRDLDGRALRTFDLQVRFLLDLPEDECVTPEPDAAVAAVLTTSSIALPHADTDAPELVRFPASLGGGDGPIAIVVADDASRAELAAAVQLAAAVGRFADGDSVPPTLDGATAAAQRRPRGGLIVVGAAAASVLGIDAGSNADGVAEPEAPRARVRLVDSPFDGDARALVVDGDEAALAAAVATLTVRDRLVALDGSDVLVTTDLDVARPVVVAADVVDADPPVELAPRDAAAGVPSYVVPAMVIGLALAVAGALAVWYRWGRRLRRRRVVLAGSS